MRDDDLDISVVDWVIDHPASVAVFEKYSIDYCCAGKSLEYACLQAGASPQEVLASLRRALAADPDGPEQR